MYLSMITLLIFILIFEVIIKVYCKNQRVTNLFSNVYSLLPIPQKNRLSSLIRPVPMFPYIVVIAKR